MSTRQEPERKLVCLQSWLFERVTRPAAFEPEPGARAAADVENARVVRGGVLGASDRVEIYRRAYWSRLVECLADDYRAVAFALGAQAFRELCLDFIEANPPRSPSLNHYGAPFAAFCAARRPPLLRGAIAELARLEWALVEAIHAEAAETFDLAALGQAAALAGDRLRLDPSPALTLLELEHPLHVYYQAFLDGDEPSLPSPEAAVLAVCRRGDDVWRVPIAPGYVTLLRRLTQAEPLGVALASLEEPEPSQAAERALELQRTLGEWISCGFFRGVRAG